MTVAPTTAPEHDVRPQGTTVGFSDRLRAWFKGESKRSAPSRSTGAASRSSTRELEEFVRTRHGVEAFLEPKTTIYSTTLLLVADDGEYLRRPIRSREQAGEFCGRTNIPLYDAAKVGYPRRMREYERGNRPRKVDLSELPPWPGDELPDPGTVDGPPPPPVERTASDLGGPPPDTSTSPTDDTPNEHIADHDAADEDDPRAQQDGDGPAPEGGRGHLPPRRGRGEDDDPPGRDAR